MFVPRFFVAAGIALIAISLGAAGHGLWWLVGLVFAFGHCGRGGRWGRQACAPRAHRGGATQRSDAATTPATTPDPTRDRHEAFPTR